MRELEIADRQYDKIQNLEEENILLKIKIEQISEDLQKVISIRADSMYSSSSSGLSDIELLSINKRIDSVKYQVEVNSQSAIAFRQALDPINPDEILTIIRLKDEIKTLNKRQNDFEKRIENNIKILSETITFRSESSDRITNLIFLALIPIIINFLYAVWKDYKKEKPEETSANKN